MTQTWDAYDSLMPSDFDLSQGWRTMPVLPPMRGSLIVPYQYAQDRKPTEPRFDVPDGMVREQVEILKDGGAVHCMMRLGYVDELNCVHTFNAGPEAIRHAVLGHLKRLQSAMASGTKLCLVRMPWKRMAQINLDDKDGRDVPEVEFVVAVWTPCRDCGRDVCTCAPTDAEELSVLMQSATAAENGRCAESPSETR